MRAFLVRLPSGQRYWTVLDEDLSVVGEADAFLRHVRFGRDGSELTTRAYAGGIALFLRWCARSGRHWHVGVEHLGLFITWLRHAGPQVSGADAAPGGQVLAGPGRAPVRGARRVNAVLCAVRGFVSHAVTCGHAPGGLLALIYELADERDLPEQARGEDARMAWRMRARHRLREPDADVDRADDADIVALLRGCRSARDRLIVLLMARAGLRRGEVCGLRRSDLHLLPDSRALGCEVERAHLHVARRDNPNGAWAKSRRQRVVPLDFLVVQAVDGYEFERLAVARAGESDFVLVNLFREPVGAPMRPDAINELMTAASRRAGLDRPVRPHQLRHAFGSNLADAGGGLDEIAELLGHVSMSSSQVYLHPDPGRLREAVERVPSPRELTGADR
ncbi:MAG: site-specific integrase [Actinomycetia bacterium]|nr:site-specific integrase [Actinomycetes bacterium]